MRDKFFRHGAEVFDTYELLEMLLYYRIPYKDTNPIAHRLLQRFGTLDRVLCADERELCLVDGVGEQVAAYLRYAADCGIDGFLFQEKEQVLNDYERVGELFLSTYEGDGDSARSYLLLLDNRMRPLSLEPLVDVPFSELKPQALVTKALLASAAVAIIASSHPHGPLFILPDERVTDARLRAGFEAAGVVYAEHYLFCGQSYIGCLSHTDAAFRQYRALEDFEESRRRCRGAAVVHAGGAESTYESEGLGPSASPRAFLARLISPACPAHKRAAALDALISRFGMIQRILETDAEVLASTPGVGRSLSMYIKLLVAVTSRRFTDAFALGEVHSADQIEQYFSYLMMGEHVECVYMLMLNKDGAAIACERVTEGAVNSSEITPRRFLEIAVRSGASQVILAHNHPGGSAIPSDDDYRATAMLQASLDAVDIRLLDHYVVAGHTCVSMQAFSLARRDARYRPTFSEAPPFYQPRLRTPIELADLTADDGTMR